MRPSPDKRVVDAAAFEQTLGAALTPADDNLLVVARTDARAPLGLDAAIERANRYAQAGADIIFVEAAGRRRDRADRSRRRRPC
jgi:2-methylisocitrate lyase-like PEP mutase family enzyme